MWMACRTFREIGDAVDCSEDAAEEVVSREKANLPISGKTASDHATDFDPPIYNVWKQQEKTAGASHFGKAKRPDRSRASRTLGTIS